jgi:hypothetical protein
VLGIEGLPSSWNSITPSRALSVHTLFLQQQFMPDNNSVESPNEASSIKGNEASGNEASGEARVDQLRVLPSRGAKRKRTAPTRVSGGALYFNKQLVQLGDSVSIHYRDGTEASTGTVRATAAGGQVDVEIHAKGKFLAENGIDYSPGDMLTIHGSFLLPFGEAVTKRLAEVDAQQAAAAVAAAQKPTDSVGTTDGDYAATAASADTNTDSGSTDDAVQNAEVGPIAGAGGADIASATISADTADSDAITDIATA